MAWKTDKRKLGKRGPKKRKTGHKKGVQNKFKLTKPQNRVVKQVASILETKKFQGITPNANSDGWLPFKIQTYHQDAVVKNLPIDSFLAMRFSTDVEPTNPETSRNCLEGSSLFAKYLTMRVQIDYPDGSYAPTQTPRPMEIIWGFTHPFNYTEYTTPRLDEVSLAELQTRIENTVKEEFNNQADPMIFHDKKKRLYNIVGRRKIIPKFNRQVPNMTTYLASASKIMTTINFPMMKKVEYTTSFNDVDHQDSLGSRFAYPNQAYVPFVIVVDPDNSYYSPPQTAPDPNLYRPEVKFNDCLWFNDA